MNTNFDIQDQAGHIWAAVWDKALGSGVSGAVASQLADVAQKAFLETIEAA